MESPPRFSGPTAPQRRPRTDGGLDPALLEFLRSVGEMAADAVLAKARETKGLGPASIKAPRGNYSEGKVLRKAGNGEAFEGDSSGVLPDAKGIHRGR